MTQERMRGLGPRSQAQLQALGIHTLAQLQAQDPYELYARLKAQWPQASMNLLYALMGAQEQCDWRVIARSRRTEALLRLDEMGLAPR